MESRISAIVPPNPLQDLVSQIQEKQDLITQKILAFEIFREQLFIILFFLFIVISLLIVLNLILFLKLRRSFSFFQNHQENVESKKKNKNKAKEKRLIEKLTTKVLYSSSCKLKTCLFFRQNKPCQLKDFSRRLAIFSQSLFKNLKNETLIIHLSKLGKGIEQNCNFSNNSLILLKKQLKKVKYLLNKIKKEKGISKKIKHESKLLWDVAHSLILKIKNFLET